MEQKVIRLDKVIEGLKKRWLMIVSITLILTIAVALLSFFVIKPKYQASIKVFIGKEEGENVGYNQNDVIMYQKLMKTYSEAIRTRDLIEESITGLNIDLDVEKILSNLTIVTLPDTQILQMKYVDTNPKIAKIVVENITDKFIEKSRYMVSNGNIQIIEKAKLPEQPISPNKFMNIVIAFLLGIMISVGLVLLLEFLDNTFKSKEELEEELEIPVIGAIPEIKGF